MRVRAQRAPAWARILGTALIVVLPLLVASVAKGFISAPASLAAYPVLFLIVGAGPQLGLIVRRWGNINVGRLFFDLGLLVVAGLVAWVVVNIAMHRGGGPVDPSLIAVIMAYLLAIWSGQHP
ncbi:MAG: hypothetical protein M1272_06590 [Firmicutes bacterium]|nr:hypothetical protein [Bacillota bacterium]